MENTQVQLATDKQLKYRRDLIDKKVKMVAGGSYTARNLLDAIAAVNLPEPVSKDDASAQIKALKKSLLEYMQANQAWGQRLMDIPQERMDAIREAVKSDAVKNSIEIIAATKQALSLG